MIYLHPESLVTMKPFFRYILGILSILTCSGAAAQSLSDFYVESRIGAESEWLDSKVNDTNTGFKGQWLNLRLDGEITDGLTFSYRQRLNKNTSRTFFDATDWLHLDWKITDRLTLSGGKQVVAIGGYEYDRAPIDLYYCSEFWNNIPCYQFGVSTTWAVTDSDSALLQVCNSPFREWSDNNKYAFNLMWYGSHGFWETMWSVNMIDLGGNEWMNYISLGNRFNFTDWLHLDIDLMSRTATGQTFLTDWSVMSELSASPMAGMRLFTKYTRDRNHSDVLSDYLVQRGTDISMASAGMEYTPADIPDLKLFAVGSYGWGTNTNLEGTRLDRQFLLEIGAKCRLDILNSLKR